MRQELPDHSNWVAIQDTAADSLHQLVLHQLHSHMNKLTKQTAPLWLPATNAPSVSSAPADEDASHAKLRELKSQLADLRRAERELQDTVHKAELQAATFSIQPVGMELGTKHAVTALQEHRDKAHEGNAALQDYATSASHEPVHTQLRALPECVNEMKENHAGFVNPSKYLK